MRSIYQRERFPQVSEVSLCQMKSLKKFQATQITPSLSTATLAHSGNPNVCFTSRAPDTWIIDTGASNHIMGNKKYSDELPSLLSLPTVILANGTTSRVESVGTFKVNASLHLLYVFTYSSFHLIYYLSINLHDP